MGEPTLAKKLVNELVETIEDVATALIGLLLVVFTLGAWYGSQYAGQPQLWYPLYLFVILLVLKLVKDVLVKLKK